MAFSISNYLISSLGRPIEEIEYPAVTICSQGWIENVINRAIDKQMEEYLLDRGLNSSQVENILKNATLKKQWELQKDKDLYPGATKSVSNMVKTMSVNNPVLSKLL